MGATQYASDVWYKREYTFITEMSRELNYVKKLIQLFVLQEGKFTL